MKKGEKERFLSPGDREDFTWFFEAAEHELSGLASPKVGPRPGETQQVQASGSRVSVRREPENMDRRLSTVRRFARVQKIARYMLYGPEDSAEGNERRTLQRNSEGEHFLYDLHDAYVLPMVVKGATKVDLAGRRWVFRLPNGFEVQVGNHKVVGDREAIPGIVCREGAGTRQDKASLAAFKSDLVRACRAWEAAREACGFPDRKAGSIEVPFAAAAELTGMARSSITRIAPKNRVVERKAKHGNKLYKMLLITTEDGEELGFDVDEMISRIAELQDKMRARVAVFTG